MGFGVLNVISERSERMRRRGKGGKSSGRTIIDLIKRFKWGLSCRKSANAKAWSRLLSLTPAASITNRLRGKSSLHVREKARNDMGSLTARVADDSLDDLPREMWGLHDSRPRVQETQGEIDA